MAANIVLSLLQETNSALPNHVAGLVGPVRGWENDRVKGKKGRGKN